NGILAFPPYYPSPDDDGIVAYYRAIAEATPLGLLIYTRDWFNPTPALAERLTQIPNLIGWKDGQADLRRYQMIRERVGDRLHWIGGAGDDMVPGYTRSGFARTLPALPMSRRAFRYDCTNWPRPGSPTN